MQDNNKSKRYITIFNKVTKAKGFTAFTSALLAIALGLIFGLLVMFFADASSALSGFE